MAAPAKMRLRNEKHSANITKRGLVNQDKEENETGYRVGPILLGFFLFVLVGSSFVEILRAISIGS